MACGHKDGCTPRHVFLGECGCTRVDWSGYLQRLERAVGAVEKLVPRVELDASVPLARWCPCRRLVRGAWEAVQQRRTGGQASAEGWRALLMVAAGLLPGSLGAESLEERARWQLEAAVARAVVELQQVMVELLHSFRMATRSAVGRKTEALEGWLERQRRRRAVRTRMRKLLQLWAVRRRLERKRRLETLADTVVAAQVAAAEDGRRKTARMGAEAARTRAGGLHRVGVYDEKRGRKAAFGWEAGICGGRVCAGW